MSLSVVHFSDIHIKGKDDLVFKRTDQIKFACAGVLPSEGTVIIAISGDIAFSGKKDQYEEAIKFLKEIVDHIIKEKNSKVYLVCVPGNHDCDFEHENSVRKTLINSAKIESIDDNYYGNVLSVQEEYLSFAKSWEIDTEKVLPIREFNVDENKVLFILANTAWMSNLKENPGKIIMPYHLFEEFNAEDYKAVFYMYHHPVNWLNPDYKKGFIDHVRRNADIVFMGHEHARDSYEKIGNDFSVFCSHGKELQNSNGDDSAFSVFNFDASFQIYEIIDFVWKESKYERTGDIKINQYHKNIASCQNAFHPNSITHTQFNDIGISVNHFAKEDITLSDLFVWPYITKVNNSTGKDKTIKSNIADEMYSNRINIMIGAASVGKTSFAKMLFLSEEYKDSCCILLNGKDFTSADETNIKETIEKAFIKQYAMEALEDFRQLEKSKRIVIVDDFDHIKLNKNRRISVLDYLYGFFGRVTIFLSSSMELTSILKSTAIASQEEFFYYDILPLGNKKRKELISKWYNLNEEHLAEDEIAKRIEDAQTQINKFLGNGAAFIPAMPVFIIGTLQNNDAVKQSFNGSKYGFLYESLIVSSLSKISADYAVSGAQNIDVSVLSKLAFNMLVNKRTSFTEIELNSTISVLSNDLMIQLSSEDFLRKMKEAKIIYQDSSEGEVYRFRYPYIYYYFAGRYIAHNIKDNDVQKQLEYMSARLYNETYGNIIIFVCHFANRSDVIDNILLNACFTLESYETFDFIRTNPIFDEIQDAVEALVPNSIVSNDKVVENKDKELIRMDEVGINDGRVVKGEETIDDEISEKEKDLAAIISALKTIEVLGQILQNYPGEIRGNEKIDIINIMHKLGMRSVQAIIKTMGYLEEDLVEFVFEKVKTEKKDVRKEEVAYATRKFINILISGISRGMVDQVAASLNSKYLLPAVTNAFEEDETISSKLILLDLKLNYLKNFNYQEIKSLKRSFDKSRESFASRILDSIVGHYLNYNKCNYDLRRKLCELCGFSEKESLLENRKLLNS